MPRIHDDGGGDHAIEEAEEDPGDEHFQFKVALIGAQGVGKTSLLKRCIDGSFPRAVGPTLGVDFYKKEFDLPGRTHVALQLWDVGGRTLSSKMTGTYMYGCQAALLVYDPSSPASFQELSAWLVALKAACRKTGQPYLALVANKSDLIAESGASAVGAGHSDADSSGDASSSSGSDSVQASQHNAFAKEHGAYSYCVSALTGDGALAMLVRIAADLSGVPLSDADLNQAAGVDCIDRGASSSGRDAHDAVLAGFGSSPFDTQPGMMRGSGRYGSTAGKKPKGPAKGPAAAAEGVLDAEEGEGGVFGCWHRAFCCCFERWRWRPAPEPPLLI